MLRLWVHISESNMSESWFYRKKWFRGGCVWKMSCFSSQCLGVEVRLHHLCHRGRRVEGDFPTTSRTLQFDDLWWAKTEETCEWRTVRDQRCVWGVGGASVLSLQPWAWGHSGGWGWFYPWFFIYRRNIITLCVHWKVGSDNFGFLKVDVPSISVRPLSYQNMASTSKQCDGQPSFSWKVQICHS